MPVRILPCPICGLKGSIELWYQRENGQVCPEDIRQDCDCELLQEHELALINGIGPKRK